MEKIVLAHMKRVLAYVQQFETSFVKREMEKANLKCQTSVVWPRYSTLSKIPDTVFCAH